MKIFTRGQWQTHPATPSLALVRPAACALALIIGSQLPAFATSVTNARFAGPTSSQPLALTADDAFLVVANPDNNSVSFFDLRGDINRRLATVPVGRGG